MAAQAPGNDPVFEVSGQSRVGLPRLSIVRQGDEYIVGDPATARFLLLPEVGVVAIDVLRNGGTVGAATEAASAFAGEYVDVIDFVGVLAESGLVRSIDGRPTTDEAVDDGGRSWIEAVRPELVRPFFSAPAWTVYGLVALYCVGMFIVHPHYWPSFHDFFFVPDAAICVLAMLAIRTLLTSIHEVCHWLAARAAGVAARFSLSRRLYYVVFETDLSQLWSVPRGRRFSAMLAGMAFDVIVLALCLTFRLVSDAGIVTAPQLLVRLAAAIALGQVIVLGWQMQVYLRTDMYAVLVNALGCTNLYRVNQLTIKRRLRRLSAREESELGEASVTDVRAARWFSWVSIAGGLWCAYVFIAVFIPDTVLSARWALSGLASMRVGDRTFWEALGLGAAMSLQVVLPLWMFVRDRNGSRRAGV